MWSLQYFSRYPVVIKLRSTTSSTVIDTVKAVFSRHGIPETMHSDKVHNSHQVR